MKEFDLKHWWSFGSKLSETTFDSKVSYDENHVQSTENKIDPKLRSKNFHSPTEGQKQDNLRSSIGLNTFHSTTIKEDGEYHGILYYYLMDNQSQ